ncbi:MAG: hypothetical protein DRO67_00535 [Candidatus Asgardarchaeum californiense]|nr:MAG: hypothetical protein DRO67_00535 [Candidatus Asgardarchaeum californiense]
MEGSVFMVVVVENPTKKDVEENDAMSKVILGPEFVVADTDQAAATQVLLGNEKLREFDQKRIELVIRPF